MAIPQWNYIEPEIQGMGLAAPSIQAAQQGLTNSLSGLQQLGRDAEIAQARQNAIVNTIPVATNDVGLVGRAIQPNTSFKSSTIQSPELEQGNGLVNTGKISTPVNANQYMGLVDRASKTYGVPREVILGVIQAESGFKPNAVSPTGVRGLMQVTGDTYRGLGFTGDRADPSNSVNAGTKLLSQLYSKYGNWDDAFSAYNGGDDAVKGMRSGNWGVWANNPNKQKEISQYASRVNNYRNSWIR